MAALSGHDKMAAETAGEYMQVVVGGDLEPGQQVVVLQGATAEEMRVADISQELLQTIAHTDTIYYVQPDGSLVPGGTLAEVTGGDGTVGSPVMMDAALQLKNVADHVALKEGAPTQVARILNQKQLKSICVQVPGLKPKEPSKLVNAEENTSAPVNVSSENTSLLSTQVVEMKAVPQPPQPLVVKAVQPPVQVMIQQTPTQMNTDPNGNDGIDSAEEHGCCVAHHQHGILASGTTEKGPKKGQKRKKPIKIKTRSGRISRPPKHKSKDYKYLKVGDSIQDTSADSDDYSELSSEDEDDGSKEKAPKDGQPYNVKNSLFQCQKCEKSYMGKGGLFRHYRLYPAHGQMDPSFILDAKKGGDSGGTVEHKKPIPRPRKRLLEDPANPIIFSQQTFGRDGLVQTTTQCTSRRQMSGRRFGRPRKILHNGNVEEHALTVKELIQQCDEKDLKEQVAPSFTKLLSVYDFLVLKVKQDHMDNRPLFPKVYRELEKLHSMVKNLAEEYVINMDQNVEKPLEVTDTKLAESLGISKEMTVKVPTCTSVPFQQETWIEEHDKSSDEELPSTKRLKTCDEDCNDNPGKMTAVIGETAQNGGLGQNNEVTFSLALQADTGIGTPSEEAEHVNAASHNLPVEVAETLPHQINLETEDTLEESLVSAHSTDTSQTQDLPLNLSCQLTEEILSLQSQVVQPKTRAVGEETSVPLPLGCELQRKPANLEIPCDASLASIDCSQVLDHARTVVSTSVPTTLAEAMCREASQLSFVEVGGALIPTTNTYTTGNLSVSGVTPAFSLNHGHEVLFIHSGEETATEEAVVIFDNTGATETHLDTVVALVEM